MCGWKIGNTKCKDCTSKIPGQRERRSTHSYRMGEEREFRVRLTVSEMYKMSPSSKYSSSGCKKKKKKGRFTLGFPGTRTLTGLLCLFPNVKEADHV